MDGHAAIYGGSGSGKSSCSAIPSIRAWKGPIFAVDVKGELVTQPTKFPKKILNLNGGTADSSRYDPFYLLRRGGSEHLIQNSRELANAIVPLKVNERDEFWPLAARSVLTASIAYHFSLGLNFIETMIQTKMTPLSQLVRKILESNYETAKGCVTPELSDMSKGDKMVAGIRATLDQYLTVFVTDPTIQEFLTPCEDLDDHPIQWGDLETNSIFVQVDQNKLGQYGNVMALIITQLIRYLERRPDKEYKSDVNTPKPILLLLDEFPRLGKVEIITNALATLRFKNVTIALYMQSMADLDAIYGENTCRRINDNCAYKAILNAGDPETQRQFSEMVGSYKTYSKGYGISGIDRFTFSLNETRRPIIFPHEFGSLKDIVVLHPEGFARVDKVPFFDRVPPANAIQNPQSNRKSMIPRY